MCLHRQLSESREEQLAEQAESARLLDIKAARIQKLEKQLRDIAYGTRHYKIDTGTFEVGVAPVRARRRIATCTHVHVYMCVINVYS